MKEYPDNLTHDGESDTIKKLTKEMHDTYPKAKGWIPFDCYDMVQCGYPLPDHGEMVLRPDGGTNEKEELLPSNGMWCKVKDVLELLESIIQDCPNCDNVGWYAQNNCSSNPWEAEQVQCEWCNTTPNSRYNYENQITKIFRDSRNKTGSKNTSKNIEESSDF